MISEILKDAKNSLILIKRPSKGFAIKSKTKTAPLLICGISAKIEPIKPMKLKIPIKGTTAILANMLSGARLLK